MLLIFHAPSKTTLKEVKMTFLLVSLVATHLMLTLPSNITALFWTILPEHWVRRYALWLFFNWNVAYHFECDISKFDYLGKHGWHNKGAREQHGRHPQLPQLFHQFLSLLCHQWGYKKSSCPYHKSLIHVQKDCHFFALCEAKRILFMIYTGCNMHYSDVKNICILNIFCIITNCYEKIHIVSLALESNFIE